MSDLLMKGFLWLIMGISIALQVILDIIMTPAIVVYTMVNKEPVGETVKEAWTAWMKYIGYVCKNLKDM